MALNCGAERSAWPAWLSGWLDHEVPEQRQAGRMARWLATRRQVISTAYDALMLLRDHELVSVISRADQGHAALAGMRPGATSHEDTTYGRLAGDADWYRRQRAVMTGFGQIRPDDSIKPANDHSSDYIS